MESRTQKDAINKIGKNQSDGRKRSDLKGCNKEKEKLKAIAEGQSPGFGRAINKIGKSH